jgi:hypothetical protein
MRTQILLLIAGLWLMMPCQVTAQESADEAAVRKVVEYYFDGFKNESIDSMKKAFHQQAVFFFPGADGALTEVKQLQPGLFSDTQRGNRPPVVTRIISMWVSEQAASVRVEFRYPTGYPGDKADFRKPPPGYERTEYLSLIKFKQGWQIVTRVISVIRSQVARSYSPSSAGNATRRFE